MGRNCNKMWLSLAGTVIKCGVFGSDLIKFGFAQYVCLVGRNCYKMWHCVFVWPVLCKIYRCLFVCLFGRNCYKMVYVLRTFYLFGQNCYTMWRCLFGWLVSRNFIKLWHSVLFVCLFGTDIKCGTVFLLGGNFIKCGVAYLSCCLELLYYKVALRTVCLVGTVIKCGVACCLFGRNC